MHQLNDMTAVRSGVRLAVFLDQIEAMNPETEFWQTLSSGKAPQFLDGAPHRGEGGATTLIYDGGKLVGVSVCQRDENNRTVLVCVDLRPANHRGEPTRPMTMENQTSLAILGDASPALTPAPGSGLLSCGRCGGAGSYPVAVFTPEQASKMKVCRCVDVPEKCEGCGDPATTSDAEGVPLCQPCYDCIPDDEDVDDQNH